MVLLVLKSISRKLQQKNVLSVKIIGHSVGGYYAQLVAEMYPKIVNGQCKFITFTRNEWALLDKK